MSPPPPPRIHALPCNYSPAKQIHFRHRRLLPINDLGVSSLTGHSSTLRLSQAVHCQIVSPLTCGQTWATCTPPKWELTFCSYCVHSPVDDALFHVHFTQVDSHSVLCPLACGRCYIPCPLTQVDSHSVLCPLACGQCSIPCPPYTGGWSLCFVSTRLWTMLYRQSLCTVYTRMWISTALYTLCPRAGN